MGYLKIPNLYKDQRILDCGECWALEKIHGTSAHIKWNRLEELKHLDHPGELTFFSGGEKYENFVMLFNAPYLWTTLASFARNEIIMYGEAYGGKLQGMKETYGKDLKFVVFDVKFDGQWLNVLDAHTVAKFLKLEFVDYVKIPTTLSEIDAQRDRESVQAIRNGIGPGKRREGIVLRPLSEMADANGDRIIAKHKQEGFCETKRSRVVDQKELEVLANAKEIAREWVTPMRLRHVLDAAQVLLNAVKDQIGDRPLDVGDTGTIIKIMTEDIQKEGKGEFVETKDVIKAIGNRTAKLYHVWLKDQIKEKTDAQ